MANLLPEGTERSSFYTETLTKLYPSDVSVLASKV